ncbi:hypothetical protein F7850_08735 [Campylobacter jejuni]|nr:hypothetical protein [Campylobacter jejuni]
MIVAKKTLSDQGVLNSDVIKWAIEVKTVLAKLDRLLTIDTSRSIKFTVNYIDDITVNYIDDITPEEIQAGTQAVKEYCISNNELELLKKYLPIVLQDVELLSELKALKLIEINNYYESTIKAVQKEYIPNTEMLSFETQERESLAYKNSNYQDTSLCPFMIAISTARGMDLRTLCDKALEKATLYRQAIGMLIGKRQGLQDRVGQAQSLEDLNLIIWE